MTCDRLRDEYELFALGLSDEPETVELRLHLGRDCPNCVPGVRASIKVVTRLALIVPRVDPPARLRKRIVASVKPAMLEDARSSRGFGWSVMWGGAAAVFLAMSSLLMWQLGRVSKLRAEESARTNAALEVIRAADSVQLTFGTNQPRPPRGRVFINPKGGVVLMASNLPRLQSGKTFELWLIPKGAGAKPVASGLFAAREDRTGLILKEGPVDPREIAAVAVSVEDEAGATAPTTKPIIAASLAG